MKQKLPLRLHKEERRKDQLQWLTPLLRILLRSAYVSTIIIFSSNLSRGANNSAATSLFHKGDSLLRKGLLQESFRVFEDLKFLYEEMESDSGVVATTRQLAKIKARLGLFAESRQHFESILSYAIEISDTSLIAGAYNDIGCTYYQESRFDSIQYYFDLAQRTIEGQNDLQLLKRIYLNQAAVLIGMGNPEKSIPLLQQTSYLNEERFDTITSIACKLNLGVAYLDLDNYDSSNHYLNTAYSQSKEFDFYNYQVDALLNLGHLHYNFERFQEACDYYETHYNLKDSIFNVSTAIAIKKMENENALAMEKLALKESELATITWQRWAIAIGALFILGIVLGFGAYRRRVAVQQARTQAVLETREDETKRITDLLWSEIGASTKDGKLSLPGQELPEHTIPGAIAAARFLSSQQYNPYLQLGLKRAVDHLLSTLNKGKDAQVAQELEEIDIDKAERLAYYRMLENILVQVFSRANTTTISVQMAKQKNNLVFEVTANEILDPTNKRFQSAEARVQQFKGKMKFEERDNSTTIKVDVPLSSKL